MREGRYGRFKDQLIPPSNIDGDLSCDWIKTIVSDFDLRSDSIGGN